MSLQGESRSLRVSWAAGTAESLSLLGMSIRAQAIFLWIAAAHMLMAVAAGFADPRMRSVSAFDVIIVFCVAIVWLFIVMFAYVATRMAVRQRPARPVGQLLGNLTAFLTDSRRMASGIPVLVCLALLFCAFLPLKSSIPVFAPFAWDETFDRWDMALHFGRRPWEWLHPLLGHWPVTLVLSVNYVYCWFLVVSLVWLHVAFFKPPGERRTRFLLSFPLVWIIGGNILAAVFSSAGPCFYGEGRLGVSPDPYAALMSYLRDVNDLAPVWSLQGQSTLWSRLVADPASSSISAMPSIHNGMALLIFLASRTWSALFRGLLLLHAVLIFLGSIHLGWHYAVDAYIAWLVTFAIWLAMAPVSRWWENRPAARRFRIACGAEAGGALA